jgi:hypothetical protein
MAQLCLVDNMVKVVNLWGVNRLTIEIDPEQHRQIKTLATFSGMTIKDFILSKTLGNGKRKASVDPTEHLMGSAKNAARLRKSIASSESEHRVFESVKELKDALGI